MKEWIFLLFAVFLIEHSAFTYRVFAGYETIKTSFGNFGGAKGTEETRNATIAKVSGFYQTRLIENDHIVSLDLRKDGTFSFQTTYLYVSYFLNKTSNSSYYPIDGKWELQNDKIILSYNISNLEVPTNNCLSFQEKCFSSAQPSITQTSLKQPNIHGWLFLYENDQLRRVKLYENQALVLVKEKY